MDLLKPASLVELPDQHFSIEKCTFGEQARKRMGKIKKEQERDTILRHVCALLNSGGGVMSVEVENEDYDYDTMGLGEDLEGHLTKLLEPFVIEDFIEFIQRAKILQIFVKSWCPDGNEAKLCSVDTGLRERSGTSTPYISPNAVVDLLKKKHKAPSGEPFGKKQKLIKGNAMINHKAEAFYDKGEAYLDYILDFGESVNVEFKSFDREMNLEKRLKENLPKYISAFANTKGGFLFIGVDDKTKKIVGCGQGLEAPLLEQMIKDMCLRAKTRAVHVSHCAQKCDFSPCYKIFSVTNRNNSSMEPRYIIALKIQDFCCAVFEESPKCWQVENNKIVRLSTSTWLEKMHLDDPVNVLVSRFENVLSLKNSPPQCKPVYSTQNITQLQKRIFKVEKENFNIMHDSIPKELFGKYPNMLKIRHIQPRGGPGILVMSTSWAVDIDLPRNKAVICEALLITTGNHPTLLSWVEGENAELWQYVNKTALHLKQKLVNLGGYTGRLCVIPNLVDCHTGELIPNKMADVTHYPDSYTLGHIREVKDFLRSLAIVVLSFTSPLSDTLGCEFFNLLTEEQFDIFRYLDGIKHLFIHGLPGSGKTLIAMEKMRRIRNSEDCEIDEILYLCENVGLKEFMRKQSICLCETRVSFMKKSLKDFAKVKHIIVDEGQNFRVDIGNWYEKAQSLVQEKDGHFWIFADYFQKSHTNESGLPPLSSQSKYYLHQIVRNSSNVFKVMSGLIDTIANQHDSKPKVKAHLQKMINNMKLNHFFKGQYVELTDLSSVELDVVKIIRDLLREGHSAKDIAVLFSSKEKLDKSEFNLKKERLPVQFGSVEEFDQGTVVLDTIRRFSGLERNIVIVVDPGVHPYLNEIELNIFLSAFSRARSRLYLLKSEARTP